MRNHKLLSAPPWLAFVLLVSGCASGAVNTANPSTGDLLFRYDKLNAYLEQRRSELDQRQAELVAVNNRLTGVLRSLSDENEVVSELRGRASYSAGEVSRLNLELGQLQSQASQLRGMLTAAQKEKAGLESRKLDNRYQSRADGEKVNKLRAEIDALKQQVTVLENALVRFRESRMRRTLRK